MKNIIFGSKDSTEDRARARGIIGFLRQNIPPEKTLLALFPEYSELWEEFKKLSPAAQKAIGDGHPVTFGGYLYFKIDETECAWGIGTDLWVIESDMEFKSFEDLEEEIILSEPPF